MKSLLHVAVFVWAGAIFCSCASTPHPVPVYQPEDNKYTSAFPSREVSEKLSRLQNSVQRIVSTVTYRIYYIGDNRVTREKLLGRNLAKVANSSLTTSKSNAGTAISILQNADFTVLITAYHITASPDTVISYKRGEEMPDNTFVKSIAVKLNGETFLFDNGSLMKLHLIASKPLDDLALLLANNEEFDYSTPPLRIQTGTAKNLQLGSFIYVLGFPLGRPMVTRGIVSAANYDNQGSFLTDALFNHGISGGLIIASNDNYESFEWVGMSSTASVKREYFLVPNPGEAKFYHDFEIYADSLYIDQKSFINYGVSKAIPIEDILEFLYSNEEKLNKFGLSATDLAGQ